MIILTSASPAESDASGVSLYRALWRWHFFAGLLAIPFMLNLAITGGLYLFKDEINDTFFAYRYQVEAAGSPLSPDRIVEIAASAVPGSAARSYKDPASATRSAIVTVSSKAGSTLVFVNPYDGDVLDTVASAEEFNQVVRSIHSLAYFGTFPNILTEIAGGFAMVLVATGIYLWWPRRQTGGVVTVRGNPSRRVFWRDMHAVTGAFAGLLIFFLAATGMFWSNTWGSNVQAWLTDKGLGYPAELWDNVPVSKKVTGDVAPNSGWSVEKAPVPMSGTLTGEPIGLGKAVAIAKDLGIAPGFDTAIPRTGKGVYTASIFPDDLSKERTIHIDQYSGTPLVDMGYPLYPAPGKAVVWGVNVHMGQEWGRFNQMLMLATCLAIVFTCVTAVVMWWKRRPSGRLGVPPMPPSRSVYFGLWLITLVFAIAFPMCGIAIVAMIAFDQIVVRFVPPLKRAFA
ncbi:PepSY domain-containing protein [Neorhizobium sp. AL 9.2.2]|uniref:PepSY-associated TM helix domain-containing protein n=1 Tax=Neorhizobium sp. AL 9.2.2 TaxID=2712894 RepID=UPI00157364DE|nr:PepSY domain-containing protein [Neorhizobium sp. AL 9.2.2]NSY19432.1 PepSY domain-containing protein [Neorhizobium sp. AL 9.2.2]